MHPNGNAKNLSMKRNTFFLFMFHAGYKSTKSNWKSTHTQPIAIKSNDLPMEEKNNDFSSSIFQELYHYVVNFHFYLKYYRYLFALGYYGPLKGSFRFFFLANISLNNGVGKNIVMTKLVVHITSNNFYRRLFFLYLVLYEIYSGRQVVFITVFCRVESL